MAEMQNVLFKIYFDPLRAFYFQHFAMDSATNSIMILVFESIFVYQ